MEEIGFQKFEWWEQENLTEVKPAEYVSCEVQLGRKFEGNGGMIKTFKCNKKQRMHRKMVGELYMCSLSPV